MTIATPIPGVDVTEAGPDDQRHARLTGKATTTTNTASTTTPPPTPPTKHLQPQHTDNLDILDIRQNALELDLGRDIMSLLRPARGPKQLPTLLLYDEKGLQTFEEVGA